MYFFFQCFLHFKVTLFYSVFFCCVTSHNNLFHTGQFNFSVMSLRWLKRRKVRKEDEQHLSQLAKIERGLNSESEDEEFITRPF